ncbi:MAG: type II secretion system F family protein [Rhodopirellula sp.]|nr:type II secretion system F family protein [Rhodopirellula sp.]
MNISTQTLFLVFFALVASLVLTLLINRVRRWRQRQRDEAQIREAEYEDAIRSSQRDDRGDVAARVVPDSVTQPEQPDLAAAVSTAASASSSEAVQPPATADAAQKEGPGVIHADRFMAWAPPQAEVWQPPANQAYQVSWSEQKLFGKTSNDFEEANSLPLLRPDQIPTTGGSDFVFGPATSVISSVMPSPDIERTTKELTRAGYHQPHALQNLQAVRFMMLFGVLFLGGCAVVLVPSRFELFAILGTIGVAGFVWAVPRIFLQNRATERTSQLERAMPDMLDMLNMCVSQGLTIPDSLKRISRDLQPVYPALATELLIVVHQAEVGNLQISLDNFADRVDVPEVDSFVSLLNQSERMGTNVSDALTEYSNTMRESLRQRTDEKANKAAFRLMFPTVLFMMPAVFGFLMGPAILELQEFFDQGGLDALSNDADITNISQGLRQVSTDQ